MDKVAILVMVTSLVILQTVLPVYATASLPNLSLPDVKDTHLREGGLFTTALNASYIPGITAWQVNITFNPKAIAAIDYSLGSQWTTSAYFTLNRTRNSVGYYFCGGNPSTTPCGNDPLTITNHGTVLIGFTYFSSHVLTTAETTTVLTITWKVLSRFAYSDLHIVSSSEDSRFGTLLLSPQLGARIWDPGFKVQPYTTTDGAFSNRNHRPHGTYVGLS